MKVNTVTTHTRSHRVVLSQKQVNDILTNAVAEAACIAKGKAKVTIQWDETSIDSGLRKEPQIIVDMVEDLAPLPL